MRTPLIVIKREPDEAEVQEWLSTAPGYLEGLTETDFGPTQLYMYQVEYLNRTAMFWHIDKARQTGFSYTFAGEGLAKAHLMDKYTKIFISINQEEANEKITYARAMYDSMPLAWQKTLVTDNKKCLEFEGRRGHRTTRTRIISHAQREPRGKGGNTEVVLDEAAHYTYGEQIYVAAIPIITRGLGGLTVGSTPLGKSGIHWNIVENPNFQKIYKYQQVMWWNCPDFVKKGTFKKAQKGAPLITTMERVERYGNDKIMGIFISMDLESFQQEYECHHIDETIAFIPLNLINLCTFGVVTDSIYLEDDEYAEDYRELPMDARYPKTKFTYHDNLDDVLAAKRMGIISGPLHGGFDVARRRHGAELIILEDINRGPLAMRARIEFRNADFEKMEAELGRAVEQLGLEKMRIDETGPGIELAENMLKRYPGICEPITFTNSWKEENASHIRRLMEIQNLAVPDDREVKKQIHSIKRIVTDHGNLRFDAEKNKDHHGDIFWGMALAASELRLSSAGAISVRSTGDIEVRENIIKRPFKRVFSSSIPVSRNIQLPEIPGPAKLY